jgi:ubiquinone biosynthesis protein
VAEDLEILGRLARVASTHPELGLFRPVEVVEEFRRTLLRELDLSRERRHLEQFARNFEEDPTVRVPRPFPELSARRVLTMERIAGTSVADDERLAEEGADTREIARRGASLWLEMIFRDGFYHADPHPGNIRVLPGDVVGLLDCGMVGRLDDETRGLVEDLVLSAVKNDSAAVADVVLRLGRAPQGLDRVALRRDLHEVLAELVGASLAELKLSDLLLAVLDVVRHHRIALQANVALLVKVLVILEGTSLHLDREVNLASLLEPYYAKALERRFAPRVLLARFQRAYRDWERLVDVFPRETVDILQRMRAGTFDVHLEHRKLDTTVNRLAYGLLTAALVLASSQLLSLQIPPLIGDVSVLGAAAAVGSVVLGVRLLRAVGRSGGL